MNSKEYFSWINEQPHEAFSVVKKDEDNILLENRFAEGEINVYHLETDVIEMRLCSRKDQENFFFLHFELKDDEHAKSLYREMAESLAKYEDRETVRILLSCTSGMTTSFFAEKLKEAASTLSLDYEFRAEPYSELFRAGFDYDVILLAPQIAYQYKKVKDIFPDKSVITIPAGIFGSYDAGKMMDLIKEELHKATVTKEQKAVAKMMRDIENKACIFVINVTHDRKETRFCQRLYQAGNVILTQEAIKKKNSVEDIRDILDTQLRNIREDYRLDAVSISVPGILLLRDRPIRVDYESFSKELSEEYGLPVFVCHNTAAIAYGYYAGQDKYDIVTYFSIPTGDIIGGIGAVFKGTVLEGEDQMGGEMRPLFELLYGSKGESSISYDAEKNRQAVAAYLTANICMLAPEVILIRSALTPDMEELKEELRKYFEDRYIPELIHVRDISEYAYLGTMLYGLQELKKQEAGKVKSN